MHGPPDDTDDHVSASEPATPITAEPAEPTASATAPWRHRLRAAADKAWQRLLVTSTGVLVALAFFGAHDIDRRVRAARHDGDTWSDLETWPRRPAAANADGDLDDVAAEHAAEAPRDVGAVVREQSVTALRLRGLLVPVRGIQPAELVDSFGDPRSGGREHRAIDIPAPSGTPVLAADDGVVTAIASGELGGRYLFQADETAGFVYYYAHLDAWAWGLDEGDRVRRGDVLGYVGTTGNAPVDAPHLHFAIYKVVPGQRGPGVAINPFLVLHRDDERE